MMREESERGGGWKKKKHTEKGDETLEEEGEKRKGRG